MADELSEFFEKAGTQKRSNAKGRPRGVGSHDHLENPGHIVSSEGGEGESRWSEADGLFWRAKKTHAIIPDGLYNCVHVDSIGPALRKQELNTDDLLILPEKNSEEIYQEFERFWTLEAVFQKFGFLYKRGFLLWGPPGCHAKGTRVIMYDGSTKAVEDVCVGDLLMGPDSAPRRVLELCRGRDKMYRVHPTKGEPFVVNQHHILALQPSGSGHSVKNRFNMAVNEFLKQGKDFQRHSMLYRAEVIEFTHSSDLPIPPYKLGLWIGDGHSHTPDDLMLLANKHIPHQYLTASIQDRLELLAGLLDAGGPTNGFDLLLKNKAIFEGVEFLCRSLGLAAYTKPSKNGDYWRTSISGNIDKIPCRLPHKGPKFRGPAKRVTRGGHLVTHFKLDEMDEDEYYGFILDKDHLYLLQDFTVVHNSGKTSLINLMMKTIIQRYHGIIIIIEDPDTASGCLSMVRKNEPTRPLITIMEDLDALVERWGEAGYLNLLDGSEQVNNVIHIGTTNYPERLDKRFVDRPSRFDTVKKIGMPSWDAREAYFRHKMDPLNLDWWNAEELNKWIKLSNGFSVAHLREMITAVGCFGQNIEEVVGRLEKMHERQPSSERDPDGPSIGIVGSSPMRQSSM